MNQSEIYRNSYLPYIIKWGKITCWLSVVIIFFPTVILVVIHGARIPVEATISGIIAILSASFAMYFADPLAVFPVLGTPGMYLTYLSGNSKQIRVPASLMAQDGAIWSIAGPADSGETQIGSRGNRSGCCSSHDTG